MRPMEPITLGVGAPSIADVVAVARGEAAASVAAHIRGRTTAPA